MRAIDRRMAALERRAGTRWPPRARTWIDCLTIPELRLLEILAAPHGGLLANDPLVCALVAAGRARLAGCDGPPLAVEPDQPARGAIAAVTGATLWPYATTP